MTEQMNATALHDLAGAVRDIAHRRASRMSAYEVANLDTALEQLNRFAASMERSASSAAIELLAAGEFQDPHPPTREQIAEATLAAMAPAIPDRGARARASGRVADAVLALFSTPLTREQIRDAARRAFAEWYETDETGDGFLRRFDDAVLALIQNGADRVIADA